MALLLICFHLAVLYNQQLTILDYLGLLLSLISLNIVNNISLIRDNSQSYIVVELIDVCISSPDKPLLISSSDHPDMKQRGQLK